MRRLIPTITAGLLLISTPLLAQQAKQFGDYAIHYNAINSNMIPAQVAQGYGIKRSASRALVNITVIDNSEGEPGSPARADITASAVNLTGQRRDIEMREIVDPDGGIYYIGELPINNMENFNFRISAKVPAETKPFEFEFRQDFYTQ